MVRGSIVVGGVVSGVVVGSWKDGWSIEGRLVDVFAGES